MALSHIVDRRIQIYVESEGQPGPTVLPGDPLSKTGFDQTELSGGFRTRFNAWFSDLTERDVPRSEFRSNKKFRDLRKAVLDEDRRTLIGLAEYRHRMRGGVRSALYAALADAAGAAISEIRPEAAIRVYASNAAKRTAVAARCSLVLQRFLLSPLSVASLRPNRSVARVEQLMIEKTLA